MNLKWLDLAEKNLDPEDEIQKKYIGELDGEYGWLILSNKKLQFMHEKGFLHKTYDLVLDLKYDKIRKINHKSKQEVELVDVEGTKHNFKTGSIPVSIVEKELKDLKS